MWGFADVSSGIFDGFECLGLLYIGWYDDNDFHKIWYCYGGKDNKNVLLGSGVDNIFSQMGLEV